MIRLVIFDFDDTLIRNDRLDYHSFKVACEQIKCYTPTFAEIKKLRRKQYLAKDIIKWLKKKSKSRFDEDKFIAIRNEFLQSATSMKFFVLRRYSRSLLKKLKSMNLLVVIASLRKKRSLIRLFLRKKNILKYIDGIFNAEKSTLDLRKNKNAINVKKNLFVKILKKYKIRPADTITVGNSENDLKAAKDCSILFVPIKTELATIPLSMKDKVINYNEVSALIYRINGLT